MPKLFVNSDHVLCEGKTTAIRRGSLLGTDFLYANREISKRDRDFLYKEAMLNSACLGCGGGSKSKHYFVEVSEHAFAGPLCLKCCVKKINTMSPEHGQLPDIPTYVVSVSAIAKDKNYECSPVEPETYARVDLKTQLF